MKFNFAVLSVIVSFASFGSSFSSAAIMLSFATSSPSPLVAGSSGTLDVLIHSNASDVLDSFLVEFTLTPLGLSPAGGVTFSPPAMQQDAQLTDLTYVFHGNSLSFETSQSVGTVIGDDTYIGYDATFDFIPVTLSGTDQLLFRLNLEGVAAGSYSIEVLSAEFLRDQLLADPMDPGYPDNLVPFTSTSGTITVASATAVPEPSSAALLGVAIAIGLIHRERKSRRRGMAIARPVRAKNAGG